MSSPQLIFRKVCIRENLGDNKRKVCLGSLKWYGKPQLIYLFYFIFFLFVVRLMENIRVRRAGFAFRQEYDLALQRYKVSLLLAIHSV